MKRKKIRSQRRVGHAETRLVLLSLAVAALVLYLVFDRIRQEKRHLEPVLLSKPLLTFESWGEPWHTLAFVGSFVALVVVAMVAAILMVAGLARLFDRFHDRARLKK